MKKLGKFRRSKNMRLLVMVILLVILAILYFAYEKFRIWTLGLMAVLLVAMGMEIGDTDFDIQKLIETGSFTESRVKVTENGTWLINECKKKSNFNCDNFKYQDEAQELFESCGGLGNDIHGLDRDKDGIVCESNKKRKSNDKVRSIKEVLGIGEDKSADTAVTIPVGT